MSRPQWVAHPVEFRVEVRNGCPNDFGRAEVMAGLAFSRDEPPSSPPSEVGEARVQSGESVECAGKLTRASLGGESRCRDPNCNTDTQISLSPLRRGGVSFLAGWRL